MVLPVADKITQLVGKTHVFCLRFVFLGFVAPGSFLQRNTVGNTTDAIKLYILYLILSNPNSEHLRAVFGCDDLHAHRVTMTCTPTG